MTTQHPKRRPAKQAKIDAFKYQTTRIITIIILVVIAVGILKFIFSREFRMKILGFIVAMFMSPQGATGLIVSLGGGVYYAIGNNRRN
ncbi:hypothetical protein [Companilactobacillus ginsenosidimutans]|uniref:Uncharacterized protein n=1 Tax=Companilactobacillus ginsenosidimutans TaxID=1007676 RepID=A0A0H4QG97_9LACO|nr:hypothetical protein [Companilactobacillus ginsenosidimutans]AKP67424.1 hypothetical protein ABM34_07680 [Companilactobacillus ginsenosidimutans]